MTTFAEALYRGVAVRPETFRTGAWIPALEEEELAGFGRRSGWSGAIRNAVHQVLPIVRSGWLIGVLASAVAVLDQAADGGTVFRLGGA